MDWDDEGYEDAQMEFMDSIYEFHEDSVLECHNIIDNTSVTKNPQLHHYLLGAVGPTS